MTFPSLTSGQMIPGGSLRVAITANGTTGSSNRFYIWVDGTRRDFWIVPGTTINWWWGTGSLGTGNHTLSVRVVDASGKAGAGSITVEK